VALLSDPTAVAVSEEALGLSTKGGGAGGITGGS
jgi:hypothetical protein